VNCRHCSALLEDVFVDLGAAPLSNAFLTHDQLDQSETYYPLKLFVCHQCLLVQIPEHAKAASIFSADYPYFSSVSSTWVEHARSYAEMIIARLLLTSQSRVLEIASNDGYLLQHFVARDIPCLGIEPAESSAAVARAKGIAVRSAFFGRSLAEELVVDGWQADLIIGNNVLAHVPDINDFAAGLALALKPGGTVTLEFPHLLRLIDEGQFDTIYHEHFSYLSLRAATRIFARHALAVVDVDELPTHGGSLRAYLRHGNEASGQSVEVARVLAAEGAAKLDRLDGYRGFQSRADKVKNEFMAFLIAEKLAGRVVSGYAAAAKGSTLLNYAGVRPDLLQFVADASSHKQGKYFPGSRIPIVPEARLREARPDSVVLLAWNLREELRRQLAYIGEWGGRFVVAVPELEVFSP
jgi:2-polyprenyl-3-methyl-5-hydroxy-6-metoxy-1,4-benzoquinol methylase